MSVPNKYKKIGDFHEYYSGHRVAPYLTIFVGGNHEASNYLFELYYGGWVAHNIYYLGAANVIRCGPLRICGMSGIWKGYDFRKPHFERLPYNRDDLWSIYHTRELDVRKLLQIRTQVDVGLSHDWPRKIEYSGDFTELFRKKKGFQQDSVNNRLGNAAAGDVLDRLRPAYWFSAHLHVDFAAVKPHAGHVIRKLGKRSSRFGEPSAWDVEICAGPSANPSTVDMAPKGYAIPEQLIPARTDVLARATGDETSRIAAWQNFAKYAHVREHMEAEKSRAEFEANKDKEAPRPVAHEVWKQVGQVDNKRRVVSVERTDDIFDARKQRATEAPAKNADEINLDSTDSESEKVAAEGPSTGLDGAAGSKQDSSISEPSAVFPNSAESFAQPSAQTSGQASGQASGQSGHVAEDIRSQLPASFSHPEPKATTTTANTSQPKVPEGVTNSVTKFLALDKPHNKDPYVRLLELESVSDQSDVWTDDFRLKYDKEWLAITRVFAEELHLGDPNSKIPRNMGEEFYKKRIIEEEAWIEENVVKRNLMNIPCNFTSSAPKYDLTVPITTQELPPEYTNTQTAEFCELVGIENKFHLTDQERQQRIDAARNSHPKDSPFGPGSSQSAGRGGGGGSPRGGRRRFYRGRGGHR